MEVVYTPALTLNELNPRWYQVKRRRVGLTGAFDVKPNSRLSCQIRVTDELDGLIVRTPAYQGR